MSRSLSSRAGRLVLAGAACAALLAVPGHAQAKNDELAPKHLLQTVANAANSDKGDKTPNGDAKPKPGPQSNGISYHGGQLILGTVNAYVIWYGNWANDSATSIIPNFLTSVGGSPYFKINTTYYNGSNTHVSGNVTYAGSTTDSYSQGSTLSDAGVQAVVTNAINSGLPSDPNGVYFVLTSVDVKESSGFLTQYCGWHTYNTSNNLKYAFVGDAGTNTACLAQTTSPNGNAGADGMVSVIAHELEEATTDPNLNAWYDTRGYENADKCAWTFGTVSTATNGSKYNVTLGGYQFLIQRNWVNASGGYCSLA